MKPIEVPTERKVSLEAPGYQIPAVLSLPRGARRGTSLGVAILLIPGSLFSDVNGDYPIWELYPHVYRHLALQLSAEGAAVLRFAKLGPGTGSEVIDEVLAAETSKWPGRQVIANAALEALRFALDTLGLQAERIILAGHGEGAVVASQLAAAGLPAAGVALLAAPSAGVLEILREQTPRIVPPKLRAEAQEAIDQATDLLRRGRPIPPELRVRPGVGALAMMDEPGLAYLRECDATDPSRLAAAIAEPVLIVQGGRDESVLPHHAERLRVARGDRPTTVALFSELNHMFKAVPPGLNPMVSFGMPGDPDPAVAATIYRWAEAL